MDPHMWQEKNWKEVWICDPGDDVEILVLYLLEKCVHIQFITKFKNVSSFIERYNDRNIAHT